MTNVKTHFTLSSICFYLALILILAVVSASYWLSAITMQVSEQSAYLGLYTIVQYSALTVLMLIVWYLTPKDKFNATLLTSTVNRRYAYSAIIVVAVLARLMLLGSEPYTSNDVDRYLFDGKMVLAGYDPYQVAHNDPAVQTLKALWQPPAEHEKYVTLYPPLALTLFSIAALADVIYAQLAWQIMLLLCSLITLAVMWRILKKNQCLHNIAFIAFSPLILLETGVGLHVDAFSTLAVSCALYFWLAKKLPLTGVAIGIGALFKLLPLVLLMPMVLLLRQFKPALTLVSATLITVITGYVSFFLLGFKPIGSIEVFFQKWRFASPLYHYLEPTVSSSTLLFIIALSALSFVSVLALASYFTPKKQAVAQQFFYFQASLAIPLLISPVLFPWYVMPLLPLFALQPSVYLLVWFSVLPLFYEVLGRFNCCQEWQPALWPINLLALTYFIFIFAFISYCINQLVPRLYQLSHRHFKGASSCN